MLDDVNLFCELMGLRLPLYQRIFIRIRIGKHISRMKKIIDCCKNKEELFTRLPNSDGTVDLHMNQEIFDKVVKQFCRKDIENESRIK